MTNEYDYAAYLEYCNELEAIYGAVPEVYETTAVSYEDIPF